VSKELASAHAEEQKVPRRPGRPRSVDADRAILKATIELFAEAGFGGLSIEGVAARAGVGKTTIYRRWTSKVALLRDAVDALTEEIPWSTIPDLGSARAELVMLLRNFMELLSESMLGRIMPDLIAEGARNPEVSEALRAGVLLRRQSVFKVLERGIGRGDLRPDIDYDLTLDFLLGSAQYRLLISVGAVEPAQAERVVDELMRGVGALSAPSGKGRRRDPT
jgi:AcrR family transcriptional regulator